MRLKNEEMWLILQVPENATTRDVIKQAVAKAGSTAGSEHEYVLLEEVWGVKNVLLINSLQEVA